MATRSSLAVLLLLLSGLPAAAAGQAPAGSAVELFHDVLRVDLVHGHGGPDVRALIVDTRLSYGALP